MSVTSGFFNSLNHDRRYSAQQMSAIFDGIINDGVFANIGVAFAITADSGVTINIGVGKAWFNSAWVYNDALLPKTLEGSEVVLDRIDAVVIEVDHNESVRMGDIKIVKGSPSSSPKNPTLANETNKHQYPLAYIYRKAGSTEITQADITNMVGTSSCPYITGILQVQNIDNIVAQWNAQWNQWYAEKIAETDTDASELLAEMKSEFDIWFNDIQALLEDDVATALAAQVAELQGKFDTLAREGAVYDTIEDSDFDPILGSDGTPIQGKTVLGGSANVEDIDLSGYVDKKMFEAKFEELDGAKLDCTEKFARNLLDNSNWRKKGWIINQRGDTTYTEASKYTIDRWYKRGGAGAGSVIVEDNGVRLDKKADTGYFSFGQAVDPDLYDLAGKTVTFVVNVKECTIPFSVRICGGDLATSHTICYDEREFNTPGVHFITVTLPDELPHTYTSAVIFPRVEDESHNILAQAGSVLLEWAALYEGEYTADNLPVYQPKGYGEELTECQRHCFPFDMTLAGLLTEGRTLLRVTIPIPITMRVKPSITDYNASGIRHTEGASVNPTLTSVSVNMYSKCVCVFYYCKELTAMTNNTPIAGYFSGVLSADL